MGKDQCIDSFVFLLTADLEDKGEREEPPPPQKKICIAKNVLCLLYEAASATLDSFWLN